MNHTIILSKCKILNKWFCHLPALKWAAKLCLSRTNFEVLKTLLLLHNIKAMHYVYMIGLIFRILFSFKIYLVELKFQFLGNKCFPPSRLILSNTEFTEGTFNRKSSTEIAAEKDITREFSRKTEIYNTHWKY